MKTWLIALALLGCGGGHCPNGLEPRVAASTGAESPHVASQTARVPPASGPDGSSDRVEYSPEDYAKNYALSVCLSRAFPGQEAVKQEAGAAAAGYFELGSFAVEAQAPLVALAEKFLARPYHSHLRSTQSLAVMKCIDLYRSTDLDQLARKLARPRD